MNRLKDNLFKLSKISDTDCGVTRISYTPTYLKGRELVKIFMQEAGLKIKVDPVGNLIGRWEGQYPDKSVIAMGSHIDTVPNGGRFDGAVGVLGAIEVVRTLKEIDYHPIHPIEVISFINEEGSVSVDIGGVFGSRAMLGLININKDLEEELVKIDLNKEDIINSYRDPKQFKCYLEVHIEQGNVLEKNHIPIGIVTGIVGSWRFLGKIKGVASHAGTTPMNQRDDALLKSLPVVKYVNEIAKQIDKNMVGTVGALIVKPGVTNVIPGEVILKLEFRSTNKVYLEKANAMLNDKMTLQGSVLKTVSKADPVLLDNKLQNLIKQICEKKGIKYNKMSSFAGHDSRETAKKIPSALIFIPSQGGISHSPKEFTSDDDINNGVSVLLEIIKQLDSI